MTSYWVNSMNTESIIRILDSLFEKKDSFSLEELDKIDSLVINRMDFGGGVLSVDFNDLLNFNNLSSLTIEECVIDSSVIDILLQLSNLKNLVLIKCDINEDIFDSFSNLNLDSLIISSTEFDFNLLKSDYKYLKFENVLLKSLNCYVEKLDVSLCYIDNIDSLFEIDFDEIVISFEQYFTSQLRFDDLGKKVTVMEENGQFIYKKVGY